MRRVELVRGVGRGRLRVRIRCFEGWGGVGGWVGLD